ncbi:MULTISPECIES: 16S rRNA (guanine(527)-N(7))-methyltransferase RsmG [Gordonia]|uniref:Ribosomal RNA small subunit methyltransferase G n=1 Tax=Gordonia amicalis TaxID=89053 RepID=A0AAE4U6Y0_9ACTN|nr:MULTISPECIES: 16S rRNA (guanine(527)-N(7))-methyltransferase RsmG [Gordonia]KAF0971264.1 Ribosomal RNA small subunit methyltransferase G [Gordonia sp. YY1]MCR8899367.1 16S rRNA (guanine(527)-N(7))-methyltransferase RsmG [Gordonia sp. GONU]MCZ0915404.1 16S rRNA (guanine(527)-N(7))-methyltransferase RsmG [Gordonia amicalis]MCZ4651043.1 16S rRNA (guanine(527)-N(7))-methyltransferase RsmG [Gordonia amicalis]MDJ0454343.1 16S rRNA (guanine(527)-N(7))-methyltransferase RsmG [Gordonia amicalis]
MSSDAQPDDHPDLDALQIPPDTADVVFGERKELAEGYWRILATDGIDHGLMGPREVPRLWDRHILNCAVIEELIDEDEKVFDIGSGAGLPGLPLAIARPDVSITLIEPLLRRSTFLERAVETLGLENVRVVRGRAEERSVRAEVGLADVVTSRAVAPLERLSKWSAPLVRAGGRMIAIKGSSAAEEIERDRALVGRSGISDLRVVTCGEVLETPTTVVVGTKTERSGVKKPRRR